MLDNNADENLKDVWDFWNRSYYNKVYQSRKIKKIPVDKNLVDAWRFWNHSLLNRMHPSRKIKRVPVVIYREGITCFFCGTVELGQRHVYDTLLGKVLYLCTKCYNEVDNEKLKQARMEMRARSLRLVDGYRSKLSECETHNTCDILQAHHDMLIDDPERLKTDFLIELVLGEEEKQKYIMIKK